MKRVSFPHFIYLTLIFLLSACSSGKVALERGDYYSAVMTSVERLRKNSDHTKSVETLREAYPLALSYYEDRAKTSIATNGPFKWTAVVESYTTINIMYDEIRRSPGALKVIPNPANYYSQLQEAKQNAAEENYAAGILALSMNNREKAKEALGLFKNANGYVSGYKDVNKMMEAALWAATVKVLVEPIPTQARNIGVSTEFFNDKISEYVHTASVNPYVRFFTRKEADQIKLNPDHIIKLEFDEFAVGQVFLYEKEMKLQNDSVVVGTYVAQNIKSDQVTNNNTSNTTTQNQNNTPVNSPPPTDSKTPVITPANNNTNTTTPPKDTSTNDKKESSQDTKKDDSVKKDTDQKKDTSAPVDSIAEKDQVTICHVPPGNEGSKHTLVISRSALQAHLAHGDVLGECGAAKDKGKTATDTKKKPEDTQKKPETDTDKKSDDKKDKGNNEQASIMKFDPTMLLASSSEHINWLNYFSYDTVKLYSTVKATLYYSRKSTTSKGIVSFKIIDAKTNGILSVEKMPGEYIWTSEWATFNGDQRALTPQQLQLCKQKEKVPPPAQDLFIEFTKPIYEKVTNKIRDFYKNY